MMPGVFGVLTEAGSGSAQDLSIEMAVRLEHGVDWFETKHLRHQFGFCGVVDFKSRLERSHASLNGKNILIYGDIYSSGDSRLTSEKQAEIALSLYEKGGLDFLKQLNGSFIILIYDGQRGEFIIATDRYGSRNLFYSTSKRGLLYSSEIKAILVEKSIKPQLNPEAVAEFFTFSYLLGEKTFFQGVELLSPASILICDFKENKIHIESYWDFEFRRAESQKSLKNYLEEFYPLMEMAVERRTWNKSKIGIFLSGGLDSRLIAGFAKRVADREAKTLISFTYGTKGDWQGKIASQVADKLGIKNIFYEIPSDSIAKYAEEIVYKGDGHIRIRDVNTMSLLDKVRETGVDVVLVGAFADTAFGAHLHKDMLQLSSRDELAYFLFRRHRIKQVAQHSTTILSQSLQINQEEIARKNFAHTIEQITFTNYGEIAHYWDLRQRAIRYILPLLSQLNWYLNVSDPFLDNSMIEFAMNLPYELKFEKRFIHKALRYLFPHIANIPHEKSGAPPDTKILLFYRVTAFAKKQLKESLQKASFGRVLFAPKDSRGYDYWLRTCSRKYVENTLLRANQRIFDQANIGKILKEHMTCQRNHDQLICDILNLELLLRKFPFC